MLVVGRRELLMRTFSREWLFRVVSWYFYTISTKWYLPVWKVFPLLVSDTSKFQTWQLFSFFWPRHYNLAKTEDLSFFGALVQEIKFCFFFRLSWSPSRIICCDWSVISNFTDDNWQHCQPSSFNQWDRNFSPWIIKYEAVTRYAGMGFIVDVKIFIFSR